ncbi:MAG: hypothetical protein M1814_000870 [Vezdaea aestivalis]|nr:MAG: hypothetical protein M1814_000870 [Vezdaea aestivalis]
MAQSSNRTLERLREYERQNKAADESMMDVDSTYQGGSRSTYETKLDQELNELHNLIKAQNQIQAKLRKPKSSRPPDVPSEIPAEDLSDEIEQLKVYTAAYRSLSSSEPSLPSPESPICALLALRSTHATIEDTKSSILQLKSRCRDAQEEHDRALSITKDARLITRSLESRITELKSQKEKKMQKSPSESAREIISELRARSEAYQENTNDLVASLNDFIDDYLAIMLAAEELGGPVVDGSTNLDEAENSDQKQRRIDVIWGQKKSKGKDVEKEDAASEVRTLVEELLNASVSGDANGSGTYVRLDRDSAAARFLVRARVAQFHPRDARRLRLFDFGREYDN